MGRDSGELGGYGGSIGDEGRGMEGEGEGKRDGRQKTD